MDPLVLRDQIVALKAKYATAVAAYEASHRPGGGQPAFKPGRAAVNAPSPPQREHLLCTLVGGRLGTIVTHTGDSPPLFLVQLDPGQPPWVGDPRSQNPDAPSMVVTSRWMPAALIELR